jgi:hypothetical protein
MERTELVFRLLLRGSLAVRQLLNVCIYLRQLLQGDLVELLEHDAHPPLPLITLSVGRLRLEHVQESGCLVVWDAHREQHAQVHEPVGRAGATLIVLHEGFDLEDELGPIV